MEKKFKINTELDFILEELIIAYEDQFKGIKFYTEAAHQSVKDNITQKVMDKFGLKDWEINLLFQKLLIDKYINSVEPLSISFEGLIFRNKGGYTQKEITLNSENLRIQNLENELNKSTYWLMIFTALLAFGTAISAWYFGIEIWKFYR